MGCTANNKTTYLTQVALAFLFHLCRRFFFTNRRGRRESTKERKREREMFTIPARLVIVTTDSAELSRKY
jgi:hypothetical protein